MVLFMRRIIAVLSALIVIISASPAFAFEDNLGNQEEVQTPETVTVEKSKDSEIQQSATITTDGDTQKTEENSVENQADFAYLTFYNEEGIKVLDEEKIEIKNGITVREYVEEAFEGSGLDYRWEDFIFVYNGEALKDEEFDKFEKQEIKPEDNLLITISKPEQPLMQVAENESQISTMATENAIDNDHKAVISRSKVIMDSGSWSYGNEWGVIGVSRFNSVSEADAQKYCTSLATYIDENRSAKLSQVSSSDNSKTVLALTALGYDPTDVNGYNLLEPLADFEYASQPYLSGAIWTLIAIDSYRYSLPQVEEGKTQTTREVLVDSILDARAGDGWAYSGSVPDVDMTCMAIQALSPYRKSNQDVADAINNAVEWLSNQQNSNGSFKSYGYETSESASQVIAALTSVGINPNTDSRFIKNGKSVVDSLLNFKSADGGFKHLASDSKYNNMATFQGCYALTAYKRFATGNTSIYDMSDITLVKFGATPLQRKEIKNDDNKTATKVLPEMGKTFSLGGRTIKVGTSDESYKLIASRNANQNKKEYNNETEKQKIMSILPWIYGGITAFAALALVLILRNRKAV